jgi:hypothetical protein
MDPRKHANETETAPNETETATGAAAKVAAIVVLKEAAANKKAEVMSKIEKIEALIEENPEFREVVIEGFMAVDEMNDRIFHTSMNKERSVRGGLNDGAVLGGLSGGHRAKPRAVVTSGDR